MSMSKERFFGWLGAFVVSSFFVSYYMNLYDKFAFRIGYCAQAMIFATCALFLLITKLKAEPLQNFMAITGVAIIILSNFTFWIIGDPWLSLQIFGVPSVIVLAYSLNAMRSDAMEAYSALFLFSGLSVAIAPFYRGAGLTYFDLFTIFNGTI